MIGHTLGPWKAIPKYSESAGLGGVEGPDGHICTLEDYANAAADARLIAAAPEMLEALKAMVAAHAADRDGLEEDAPQMRAYRQVRSAIAKAEGK